MAADIVNTFGLSSESVDFDPKPKLKRTESVPQNLFCPQCHDYFKNPKILPCLHFFCEDCVHNHMFKDNQITCITCHETTPNATKISDLMTHYPMADLIQLKHLREKVRKNHVVHCMNCSFGDANKAEGKFYCCDCKEIMCLHDKVAHNKYKQNHRSITIEEFMNEEILDRLLSDISTMKCKKHNRQDIKYYCVECEQHICDDCEFEEHNTHKKTFLKAALNLFSDSVDKKMEGLNNPGKEMFEEVEEMEKNMSLVTSRQKETIEKIHKHFDEINQNIEERRNELISGVNVWYSNLRSEVSSSLRKQKELAQKINTLGDFVTGYRDFPNNYKVELTSIITKRFNHLSFQLPKVPLKLKMINYEKGADNEFKIDNIGFLKYESKTNFGTSIKQITKEELVPKNVNHIEKKDSQLKMHDIQGIAAGFHTDLYLFTSECSDKEDTNHFVKDNLQILDANCNVTQTTMSNSMLKAPTQILIGKENQIYILEAEQKHIIVRDKSFHRTIRTITADDSSEISDPTSIALTSSFDLVVHNKRTNELIILKSEDFSIQKQLQLKTPIKRKESPILVRTDSRIKSGGAGKQQKLNVPEKECRSPIKSMTGSITIAVNSKDHIYVASEDRAVATIYNLEGTEIGEINFQERMKNLEEKEAIERKPSNPEQDPRERQTRKPSTLPNKNPPPSLNKRMSTIKPVTVRVPSPTNLPANSTASKTLINIDSLDNIYVYQKNFIFMFDPQHKCIASAKIGPVIDPISIHANTLGHVYVMSEKGGLHVFN